MQNYTDFADRERTGWADSGIVDAYVAKFGPITDEVANVLAGRAGGEVVVSVAVAELRAY